AEAQAAVAAAREARSSFLASLAHDIRTPINAVMGLSHLALKTALDDKQRDYLTKIQASAASLLALVDGSAGATAQRRAADVPQPEAEAAAESPSRPAAADHAGLRVLVAEDNEINQQVVIELLRDAGIGADVVGTGRLAVARILSGEWPY